MTTLTGTTVTRLVEPGARGPAVLDAGGVERVGDLVDERVGGDDGDAAVGSASVIAAVTATTVVEHAAPRSVGPHDTRADVADAHASRARAASGVAAAITRLASSMIWAGMR